MKNLKVSLKLIVSFVIVIVLAVIIGVVGIIGMSSLNDAQSRLYDSNLAAVDAIGELQLIFAEEDVAIFTIYARQYDPAIVQEQLRLFAEFDKRAEDAKKLYEATIEDASLESAYFAAKDMWNGDYANMKAEYIRLVNAEQFQEAMTLYERSSEAVVSVVSSGLQSSIDANRQWAREADADGEALYNSLTIIMIAILVGAAAISMFLAFYISSLISKPLAVLSAFMRKAGTTGDITLSPEEESTLKKFAQIKDEIGQAINGSIAFIDHVVVTAHELEIISNGDLTVDVKLLSSDDTMGQSMASMLENLNTMFAEIHSATGQVSTGSKQIADGAQALAQRSSVQAASVEQLSASIGEIASKTKENAEIADKTAKLSDTIKDNALKGSRQMDDMISAVKEINDASQSISKIIKTIDDIAFQTNILALNAAVEAARAGQHGKGFAVVAEEVRNLASKSAEAAKDTGDMIQNSMEKAELGSQIAGETATSLKDIVDGITESSQMISDIATASEEQSLGISQINVGIDQVAQVVQQNSATAEESAAASEEMSSQSTILEELISQFKLKNSSGAFKNLPSSNRSPDSMARTEPSYDGLPAAGDGDFGKY